MKHHKSFFENCFLHNYCPLGFSCNGVDINPSNFGVNYRTFLEKACDDHLAHTMRYLGTNTVIAIGKYVEKRANLVINLFQNQDLCRTDVIRILPPSSLTRMSDGE